MRTRLPSSAEGKSNSSKNYRQIGVKIWVWVARCRQTLWNSLVGLPSSDAGYALPGDPAVLIFVSQARVTFLLANLIHWWRASHMAERANSVRSMPAVKYCK